MHTCKSSRVCSTRRWQLIYNNVTQRSLYSTAWPQVDPRVKAVAPIAGGMLDNKLMANILCKCAVCVGFIMTNVVVGPALIIGGSDDFLAPPSSSVGIYSSLPSTPRLLNIIEGGWHCGFM